MNKEIKKLIPDLRFPEFMNEENWILVELGQISEIVRGGSPRPIQDYLTTNNDSLNWLKIADVPSDSKYITETKEKVIKEALNSTREVNPSDLILSNSMSFGRPYILKIKTCIHDGWIAIRKISNVTFEDYLYYFISSESSQLYFNTNAAGAAVKNLNAEIIKLLPIHIPKNLNEQQKIASCLSSLDEVIAAHSQKLELLKEHKEGLMQSLFPQEGEKVPKYRFKEFVNDGEWVKDSLGNLGTFLGGGTPDRSNADYWIGNIPWISSSDISDDNIHNISTTRFINEIAVKESATKIIPSGSVLFVSRVGVGKLAINNDELCTSQDFTSFVSDTIHNYFVGYYFSANKHLLRVLNQGTSIKGFSKSDLENFELIYPTIYQEQQKIASCLSSLDALIAAQAEKVEQLKLHKKGLMQGLFPKIKS
jgi:type I restriction enzyme, S subunit